MQEHPYLTDFGQDLTQHLWRIQVREMTTTGDPGLSNIIPFIQTVEDAAGWYLMTYDHRAMEVLLEHSEMAPNKLLDSSCFGYRFQDVKEVLEKCLLPHKPLETMISHASSKVDNGLSTHHEEKPMDDVSR